MQSSVPALPPSVGTTVALLTGLALVLSYAGTSTANARSAAKAGDEVRTKAKRLYEELLALQTGVEEVRSILAAGPGEITQRTPAEMTAFVERLGDELGRFRKTVLRAQQAASMLDRAVAGTAPFTSSLARIYPGWSEQMAKVPAMTAQLQEELARFDFAKVLETAFPSIHYMLSLTLAEQGLGEWAARLPQGEGPMVDDADGEPIAWKFGEGWIESAR